MLYEYALDPRLLNTIDRVKLFASLFGFTHGRLISDYPWQGWQKMVLKETPWKPVERECVVEMLKRLGNGTLYHRHPQIFEAKADWLRNAITEHGRRPFRAVIVREANHPLPHVLRAEDIDPTSLHPLMDTGVERQVRRTPEEMAVAVRLLFAASRRIQLIDQYLDDEERYLHPLEEMLENCSQRAAHPAGSRVEVEFHTSEKAKPWNEGMVREFAARIPSNIRLRFVRWDDNYFHNRYLITDIGGIQVGEGFAQRTHGSRSIDSWTPMVASQTEELRKKFAWNFEPKPHALVSTHEVN